jgi:hypothetical protein
MKRYSTNWVELTDHHDNKKIWVNLDKLDTLSRKTDHTRLSWPAIDGFTETWINVLEHPAEIFDLPPWIE